MLAQKQCCIKTITVSVKAGGIAGNGDPIPNWAKGTCVLASGKKKKTPTFIKKFTISAD